jgi:tetratricopeptide (TPR) repeat protein
VEDGHARGRSSVCQAIELQVLSESQASELLHSLLDADSVAADVAELVWSGTHGNPFRIEELVRALIDVGALVYSDTGWRLGTGQTPARTTVSLAEVLSARVDHLSEGALQVLREASVVGSEFPCEVLRRMTRAPDRLDEFLSELECDGLVREVAETSGAKYEFEHDLAQEAVYEDVCESRRSLLHERLAGVLESMYGQRSSEVSEELAFHYSRGLSVERAVRYLVISGRKSLQKYALEEAHHHFEHAFRLAAGAPRQAYEHPDMLADVLFDWGMAFVHRGDFVALRTMLERQTTVVASVTDRARRARMSLMSAVAEWGCNRPVESARLARESIDLAGPDGTRLIQATAHGVLSLAELERGRLDAAVEEGRRSYRMTEADGSPTIARWGSPHSVGLALWYQGDVAGAEALSARLREQAREGDGRSWLASKVCDARVLHSRGRLDDAVAVLGEALGTSADTVHTWGARAWAGMLLAERGAVRQAEAELVDVRALTHGRAPFFSHIADAHLAVCYALRSEFRPAVELLTTTMESFEESGSVMRTCLSQYLLGKVYRQLVVLASVGGPGEVWKAGVPGISDVTDAFRESERWLLRSVEAAEAAGARGVACLAYLELAEVYTTMGRRDRARAWAVRALEDAEERGADGYAEQARVALDATSS